MPWLAALGSAAGSIAGPIVGYALSKDQRDAAKKAQEEALKRLLNAPESPVVSDRLYTPEEYELLSQYTPEEIQALTLGPSAMEGISTDPRLRQAQLQALAGMQERAAQGFTEEDVALLNRARRQAAAQAQAQRSSILANMAQRGLGGAGAELASQQIAAQAAAERQSEEGDRAAIAAQQARMAALRQAGDIGSSMESADWSRASAVARAKDAINEFNVRNKQGVASSNVSVRNAAQQLNQQNRQRIADLNVALRNASSQDERDAIYKRWQDEYKRNVDIANAYGKQAGWQADLANQTIGMATGIGQGVGQAGAGLANYYAQNQQQSNTPPQPQFTANQVQLPSYDPNEYDRGRS